MHILAPPAVTRENLVNVLSDPDQRSRLRRAIDKEQGVHLPLSNLYADVARTCLATPEQLHSVVKSMIRSRRRDKTLLCGLVAHPNLPEKTLFLLYWKHCCLMELAHRAGPRSLLEAIAARYRISEAVTTLALHYYSRPEEPTEDFAAFLQAHADDYMLRSNITHSRSLPNDKREAAQSIFSAFDPAR